MGDRLDPGSQEGKVRDPRDLRGWGWRFPTEEGVPEVGDMAWRFLKHQWGEGSQPKGNPKPSQYWGARGHTEGL